MKHGTERRSAPRSRLKPSQIRHVAGRRFSDAKCLLAAGRTHANGAIYLAGIAIECHLKAELLAAYPSLASAVPSRLPAADRKRWDLLFRWHDLVGLLETLPGTLAFIRTSAGSNGGRVVEHLKQVAAVWSVMIRYDSKDADPDDARDFVARAEEVHRCLARRP